MLKQQLLAKRTNKITQLIRAKASNSILIFSIKLFRCKEDLQKTFQEFIKLFNKSRYPLMKSSLKCKILCIKWMEMAKL